MASEAAIKSVLDLLTTRPVSQIESLAAVTRNHTLDLRNLVIGQDNIVGMGIAEKWTENKKTGKLALVFYVNKKIPLTKLKASQLIPQTVPESISGPRAIPIDVVAIGKLSLELPLVTRTPLQPGYSIGHRDATAGTLGAVVSKGGHYYLLSNSHVLAKGGVAKKGDPILYPGAYDGGKFPEDQVGTLEKWVPFKKAGDYSNLADAAIARPNARGLSMLDAAIKNWGLPKGTIKPKRGMKILKVGRTTGKTVGEIRDVHFRTELTYDYGVGKIGFKEQVLCTRYTAGGDSGSLVIDQLSGKAVGLHFSGSEHGSVFNPIDEVLTALGVTLVTKAIKSGRQPTVVKKKSVAGKPATGRPSAQKPKKQKTR